MVELRKRKTPPPAPARPAKKKPGPKPGPKGSKGSKAAAKPATNPAQPAPNGPDKAAEPSAPPAVAAGTTIALDGFGGEVQTHDGATVTLKQLVDESKAGVVLFTYPKASTPGCTKQACLFRDSYDPLTATGLSIFGLSTDGPKANTTFKSKQKLPYPLLCDQTLGLIKAIGMQKPPKSTTRGVFVIDKEGKVLAVEAGSPDKTVQVVKELVESMRATVEAKKETADNKAAAVAGEVADTAATLDQDAEAEQKE
ncbi:thioredoxin-like protein [Lineolata rhizophorae]|uniref:thioredoxin-dependent peroxiredoxin n=1 Tax=Lineolata rhizophorae TaxID=578093 RepID=A0A6A6NYF3_9PEZI|nr:thioredoxin-like protein [Lineolata rhizophorae]